MAADAAAQPASARRPITATERRVLWSVAATIGIVVLFTAIGSLERRLATDVEHGARFVWNASETSARLLTVAHTIVATLFLLTSRRLRTPRAAALLAGLALLSVGLCLGFATLLEVAAPLAAALFYAYFLVHEMRDEASLWRATEESGPPGTGALPPRWAAGPLALLFALAVAGAFAVGATVGTGRATRYAPFLADASPTARAAATLGLLSALGLLARLVLRRLARSDPGGLRGALSRVRPLAVVYAVGYLVLLVGMALTGRLYGIVVLHVCVWYGFVARRLASDEREGRGPDPRPRVASWAWFRTTAAGFHALHLGVVFGLIAVAAAWALGSGNDADVPIVPLLVSRTAFPFWTITHVTLSWFPRGA